MEPKQVQEPTQEPVQEVTLAQVLKGAGEAIIEGLGKAFDFVQQLPAINDFVSHGRTELAAALNHGADGYVMYVKGAHDQTKEVEPTTDVQNPEITQSKGISL